MKTVEELRRQGYKVKIFHKRLVEYQIITGLRYGEKRGNAYASKIILPRGGKTEVHITTPYGFELVGIAKCSEDDNYCKRTGVKIALDRALINDGFYNESI